MIFGFTFKSTLQTYDKVVLREDEMPLSDTWNAYLLIMVKCMLIKE